MERESFMSQGFKPAPREKLGCGCLVTRLSENIERVIKLCDECAKLFNERHAASVAERAEARAKLIAEESARARA